MPGCCLCVCVRNSFDCTDIVKFGKCKFLANVIFGQSYKQETDKAPLT